MSRVPGRGQNRGSLPGTTLFITLRALDMGLQCYLVWNDVVTKRFDRTIPSFPTDEQTLLSPRPTLFKLSIMAFSIAIWLKHTYWLLWTCKEPMYISAASIISVVNLIVNTSHTIAFSLASAGLFHLSPLNMIFGWTIAVVGFYIDIMSETQRKNFKDKNRGDLVVYTGGLFQFARHINYTGFLLWRFGQAWAAGGLLWGLLWLGVFTLDFLSTGIPELEGHMARKYGKRWEEAKERVKHVLAPGVL